MVERILTLINKKGMSVNSVEKQLKFGNGAIKRFDTNSPSIDKIIALSNFLNVSVDYLINGDEASGTFNETEIKLITDYRLLSNQGQEYIQQQMFIAKEVYKKANIPDSEVKAI